MFKYFKIDLRNEKKRATKSISDEYNEKTLKRMEYVLKNNKWTPKSTNKKGETLPKKKLHRGVGASRNYCLMMLRKEKSKKNVLVQIFE